jgi:pimeloyl-ACP methyl ester carboxylesterase
MKFLRRLVLGLLASIALLWLALTAWAYWPGEPEIPVSKLATADDRFIVVNGTRLRYREWGEAAPGRPDLLLLHGFGNSLQSFRELAPRLAPHAHVIAIDMAGYGLSDKPVAFDYHNGPQAKLLIAAAHQLGLRHVVYVGHSLGGAVALQAAVYDTDAGGLVLLNPGIISTGVPKVVQVTLPPLPRLSAKLFGSREFRSDFLKKSYVDPQLVTPAVIDEVMLGARAEGYMAGMTSLMQQYSEGEEVRLAARVKVPTLIPWGNEDRNKPRSEADALQQLIAGSKLVRFDGAGHYVHEEAAAGVAAAITDWLSEVDPAR